MKALDIALKDLSQSFRSMFSVVFMFGIPILMTGLFYFLFGGMRNEDGNEFNLPQTLVQVANLDQGSPYFNIEAMGEMGAQMGEAGLQVAGAETMGGVVVNLLQSEAFAELLVVEVAAGPASARAAVDQGRAGVAVIIPENFTAALIEEGKTAAITLYQDPTLTLGPQIVHAMIGLMVEYLSGTKVGMQVVVDQLQENGQSVDGARAQQIAMTFLQQAMGGSQASTEMGATPLVAVRNPQGSNQEKANTFELIIRGVMSGMMVFYAFFTGGATAQSIITEDEKGTLPRLFTTPTPHSTVLTGKFLSVGLTILVQVMVLLIFGRLVFAVQWGDLLSVALATVGLVIISSTCGLFVISLLKNSRQAGVVFGGVFTTTGMIGLIKVFAGGAPNLPKALDTASLLVPQGWAMRAFTQAMDGKPLQQVLMTLTVVLVWSAVFFAVGVWRMQKRFA
ncbi:MAG: ABC transporter permease [Anaerolineales bacterium]|nr:ABC transporter permease [Anaerolineales bacterium]